MIQNKRIVKIKRSYRIDRFEFAKEIEKLKLNDSFLVASYGKCSRSGLGEFILEADGPRWVVFNTERGEDYNHVHFDTEDAACQYLLKIAQETAQNRANIKPRRLTPEEEEKGRLLNEKTKQAHRSFLKSKGLDPDTGLPLKEKP